MGLEFAENGGTCIVCVSVHLRLRQKEQGQEGDQFSNSAAAGRALGLTVPSLTSWSPCLLQTGTQTWLGGATGNERAWTRASILVTLGGTLDGTLHKCPRLSWFGISVIVGIPVWQEVGTGPVTIRGRGCTRPFRTRLWHILQWASVLLYEFIECLPGVQHSFHEAQSWLEETRSAHRTQV